MFTVKITTLQHTYNTGNVTTVKFNNWNGAVNYACGFEKSPNYHVAMYRDGKPVSYYSNQNTMVRPEWAALPWTE